MQAEIFCRVIDNFGDAGVTWRLAKNLAERGINVTLTIDNLNTLSAFLLKTLDSKSSSVIDGITISPWDLVAQNPYEVKSITIETFGCQIPTNVEDALSQDPTKSFYINLDYLSAEDWVETCHNIWGLHPSKPIKKLWFFPGFTDKTGGILVEKDFLLRRNSFNKTLAKTKFGFALDKKTFFLFTYPSAPLETLAQGINALTNSWNIALAQGAASEKLLPLVNARHNVKIMPFLTQEDFDELMWLADSAIVRGEDSFVRVQLAKTPFIWSPYVTEDKAHEIKLNAWTSKFTDFAKSIGLEKEANQVNQISNKWVTSTITPCEITNWIEVESQKESMKALFSAWQATLLAKKSLADAILDAYQKYSLKLN